MIHICNIIDDAACYDEIRRMRWSESVKCPHLHPIKQQKEEKTIDIRNEKDINVKNTVKTLTILRAQYLRDVINH